MLKINEIFGPSIQGEGSTAGTPAVFVRFAGCNVNCKFCDTQHDTFTEMSWRDIAYKVLSITKEKKYLVVFTGGEPLLQASHKMEHLCRHLVLHGCYLQIETNGTIYSTILPYFKHVVCSPKANWNKLKIDKDIVTCWKLLYPYLHDPASIIEYAKRLPNKQTKVSFYLQRMWHEPSANVIKEVKKLGYPWRLSMQLHKMLGER